jgi:hypothetical protein
MFSLLKAFQRLAKEIDIDEWVLIFVVAGGGVRPTSSRDLSCCVLT